MTNPSVRAKRGGLRALLAVMASAATLAGCISPISGKDGLYTKPIGGSPVVPNPTPYSDALVCMGRYAQLNNVTARRIAVGRILDFTGQTDEFGSREVTQGASLMAMSAFAKAGARLVERFDTSVSELELRYANNKLIGEDGQEDFRKILAGSVPGSDFYLVGGITELNFNIRSQGIEAFVGDVRPNDPRTTSGLRLFVMNVGLDLRLVDTKTLEIVDVISYQKQIIGREIRAGVFGITGTVLVDVGLGERAIEPLQLGVRSVIERAVLEMAANIYGASGPDVCASAFGPDGDFLSGTGVSRTGDFASATGDYATGANGAQREATKTWHDDKDKSIRQALRGKQGR